MINATVRTFVPEQWGEVDFFRLFSGGTHSFSSDTKKAVAGVRNHFEKALTLYRLSQKLQTNLSQDQEELRVKGYTPASNAREFSAVIEEVFTELYSSIDCTRKVLVSIYRNVRGMPDSTRKLFRRVKENQLGADFPGELNQAIGAADWYEELLAVRDELTHADIGNCWIDQESKTVTYMHSGINRDGKALVFKDVMRKIGELIDAIYAFLGVLFHFLNSRLRPTTIDQLCGIFYGRAYMRQIPLEVPVTFNSGTCQSRAWFDSEAGYRCPFADSCGAYLRMSPTHG
ncbi:MAG: hypothetical protein HYX47_06170 [Burkholderiales bacterium]|nr:hypothetical protein [Burkholderiales bacterium]